MCVCARVAVFVWGFPVFSIVFMSESNNVGVEYLMCTHTLNCVSSGVCARVLDTRVSVSSLSDCVCCVTYSPNYVLVTE